MATAKNDLAFNQLNAAQKRLVRKKLREEFAGFFTEMTTATDMWPEISDQELVEAIADALIQMGERRGKGTALLQTLVYELQDQVNQSLSK